tara:strand:- start:3753 stop:4088 length:336 start_codon:yes stop_codon:yes gene_type:complete
MNIKNIKVKNITNANGNPVANHFEIVVKTHDDYGYSVDSIIFQSYNSTIAKVKNGYTDYFEVYLDAYYWDYSITTLKHLYNFLAQWGYDLNKKKVLELIERGEFILTDLNK